MSYPKLICSECADKAGGKRPNLACFHDNICDVCNEWKAVTHPRDYGFPTVKASCNHAKTLSSLQKAKELYIAQGDDFAAEGVNQMVIQYIHSM